MNDVLDPLVSMSTYTVVPCKDSDGLMSCLYFDKDRNIVASNKLDCRAQGGTVDFLCLKQHVEALPAAVLDQYHVIEGATLFAAVVKTTTHSTGLSNTYMADGSRRLVLPVMPLTKRSTILIFTLMSPVIAEGFSLIATSDPEIGNSGGDNT